MRQYNNFIPKRNSKLISVTESQLQEAEIATSLYIYNETAFSNKQLISKALYNCILYCLKKQNESLDGLIRNLKLKHVSVDIVGIRNAVLELITDGYIAGNENKLDITPKGRSYIEESQLSFQDKKDRFEKSCEIFLRQKNVSERGIAELQQKITLGLDILFSKRGVEIARKIMLDSDAEIAATFDFETAFENAFRSLSKEDYAHYVDLMLKIMQNPSKEDRDYLALLCNGYFVYHILGHDEVARNERLKLIKSRKVFIDSNVLLPAIADFCQNHDFMLDLFKSLRNLGLELVITDNLLQEVIDHAEWAIKWFGKKKFSDISFIQASTDEFGYRQNLFVQGGMFWAAEGTAQSFSSYLAMCFGDEYEDVSSLRKSVLKKIEDIGIHCIAKEQIQGFSNEYYPKYEDAYKTIKENRVNSDSYRNELQCKTEAELLAISAFEHFSFLTLTNNLKKLDTKKRILHWAPENIYRFLKISDTSITLDNMYNCMVSDMYNCGFTVINLEILKKIATPLFNQATIELNEVKRHQNEDIMEFLSEKLIIETKEDMVYPYYVMQLQNKLSNSLDAEKQQIQNKIEELQKEQEKNKLTESERTELERYRNKKNTKIKKNQKKKKKKHRK